MNDKIIELADKWGDAVAQAIGKYGPDAAKLSETVARLDAARLILFSALTVVAGAVACIVAARLVRAHIARVKAEYGDKFDFYHTHPAVLITGGTASAGGAVVAIANLGGALNPIAWASLWEPKIWIVARLLNL